MQCITDIWSSLPYYTIMASLRNKFMEDRPTNCYSDQRSGVKNKGQLGPLMFMALATESITGPDVARNPFVEETCAGAIQIKRGTIANSVHGVCGL